MTRSGFLVAAARRQLTARVGGGCMVGLVDTCLTAPGGSFAQQGGYCLMAVFGGEIAGGISVDIAQRHISVPA